MKKAQFFGGLLSAAHLFAVEETKPRKARKPVRVKSLPGKSLWACQGGPLDNVRLSSKFEGAVTERSGNKAAHGTGEPAEVVEMWDHFGAYILQWAEDGKHTYVWKTLPELSAERPLQAEPEPLRVPPPAKRPTEGAPRKSLYEQMQERLGG